METQKTVRWGIIGLGKIARKFATDLSSVPNSELYAVASRDSKRAHEFAQEFQVNQSYGAYHDLVMCEEVDAVYIATPHSFHKEHTILCLKHQKAVLCEKPLAMDLTEVEKMISVAKETNTLLMEALWTYFLPHYQYVLKLIENQDYGRVTSLKADFGFFTSYDEDNRVFKKEVGGGSLLDIGIYPIFAALSTLGIPDELEACATFFKNGVDATCDMVFSYDEVKAELKSSLLEELPTEAIFTCENAVIKVNSRFHEPSSVTIFKDGKVETLEFPVYYIGYGFEIEHFNQLIRDEKKESDIMTFEMSKNLIKTLDKVRNKIDLTYKS